MSHAPAVGPEVQPTEAADDARERWRRFGRSFLTLRWVPLMAALLSLPLSATALFLSVQQPEVIMILPDQTRVAQGRSSGAAYVYLQPAFLSTGRNERIEVIRDMRLEVTSEAGAATATFEWSQVLRLVSDPDSGALSYQYEADAVPLLVSPRDAAAPLSLFSAPPGWFFAPGSYRFRVVAERVITDSQLVGEFRLTLTQADLDLLEQPGPDQFLTMPIAP
jgi:hypothetical protein